MYEEQQLLFIALIFLIVSLAIHEKDFLLRADSVHLTLLKSEVLVNQLVKNHYKIVNA